MKTKPFKDLKEKAGTYCKKAGESNTRFLNGSDVPEEDTKEKSVEKVCTDITGTVFEDCANGKKYTINKDEFQVLDACKEDEKKNTRACFEACETKITE